MKKYKTALKITGLFYFWIALSNVTLLFYGERSIKQLPVWFISILSIGYFIFIPLNPLFEVLGLLEGELIRGPTTFGVLVGAIIYGAILFGIIVMFTRKKNPPKS